MARKVTLYGRHLWAMDGDDEPDYPLAEKNHCDANGQLEEWCETSYAHVGADGNILRFHSIIGTAADLVDGWI